jgi:hypothetical protein
MINYRIDNRHHIIGAGVQAHGGMWPSSASNWWEAGGATGCVAAYQPKGAASLAASYSNLVNPGTYDLADIATPPTFDASTGWTFNSTQGVGFDTGVMAANMTLVVRISNAAIGKYSTISPIGNTGVGNFIYSAAATSGAQRFVHSTGSAYTAGDGSAGTSNGVLAVTKDAGYIDGASVINLAGTGASNNATTKIGSRGDTAAKFSGNILAVAIYDNTLDAATVAAVSAAMSLL